MTMITKKTTIAKVNNAITTSIICVELKENKGRKKTKSSHRDIRWIMRRKKNGEKKKLTKTKLQRKKVNSVTTFVFLIKMKKLEERKWGIKRDTKCR